jgi:thiol-disulfide isomerase/thioredoxin
MHKNKVIIFIVFCYFSLINAHGQSKFVIDYFCLDTTREQIEPGFYFPLFLPTPDLPYQKLPEYKLDTIHYLKKDSFSITRCVFSVEDTSVCLIGDGFGHQFFAVPGDTVSIGYRKIIKTNGRYLLNGKYGSSYFHEFNYWGKNRYIYNLFDSMAYYSGSLFWGDQRVSLTGLGLNLQSYFDTLNQIYNDRIAYLDRYISKYGIPRIFQILAAAEIKASYINNLLNPLTNLAKDFTNIDYPTAYIDSLKGIDFFDPDLFYKTHVYNSYSYRYLVLFKGRRSFEKEGEYFKLKRINNEINNLNTNNSIKENLLADLLIGNIKTSEPFIDTALERFDKQYPQTKYKYYVDSLYVLERAKAKITLEEALNADITDKENNRIAIRNLLRAKPTVIDCWASWCGPCLTQMPFLKEIEEKYEDKIDFIYLSFDKDRDKWLQKSSTLLPKKKSYLLSSNFKSNFANHFDVVSIPHYIIFDRNGKLISSNAPRPSNKESFQRVLNRMLSEVP